MPQILENIFNRLNPAQREAVEETEGPVMVLAGPGTGKTQVLASRIANILNNPDLQMNPENILCLTFTESGVVAMRNRLISIIGTAAYYVKIHTFHSFCNEVIQGNSEIFPSLSSVAELEQIEIIEKLISGLDVSSPLKPFADQYLYKNEALYVIKLLKRESVSPDDLEASIAFIELLSKIIHEDIMSFISQNARSLKDEDCLIFIDNLANTLKQADLETYLLQNSALDLSLAKEKIQKFIIQVRKFFNQATKVADFKSTLKDFYTKAIENIPKQHELLKLYRGYIKTLLEKRLYDFEDMLLMVINAFSKHPDLLAIYQEKFQYLLVDEYQDTNGSQNKILEHLCSFYQDQANIFVVGDDDQSIYKFQGASLENIGSFFRTYRETLKMVVLTENYRSQQNILDLSHFLVSHNQSQIIELFPDLEKKLHAATDIALEPVKLIAHQDFNSELFYIVKKIQELIAEGVQPEEIAVLVRNNKDVSAIADLLARASVPVKIYSNENILEDILIAQLIDLLRVISKPKAHSYLLFNLLHYDFILGSALVGEASVNLGVSINNNLCEFTNKAVKLREIWKLNKLNRDSELSLIELMLEHELFKPFAEKILDFHQRASNHFLDKLFEDIINEFNYLNFIVKDFNNIQVNNLQNLNQLFAEIKELQLSHKNKAAYNVSASVSPIYQLESFLAHIDRLRENRLKLNAASIDDLSLSAVQIMTAHKSKGLEFEYVFMHKCVDKIWGNVTNRSKLRLPPFTIGDSVLETKESQNDEERRLFFVAMTRAKKEVFINFFKKDANAKDVSPSLFVEELLSFRDKEKIQLIDAADKSNYGLTSLLEKNLAFLSSHEASHYTDTKVLDAVLAEYKLSVTHLNTFLKCPRKFLFQNLLRVPAAKDKSASFGTAVHNALYETFLHIKKKDIDHKAFLLKSFEQSLQREYLDEKDYADSLALGLNSLAAYYDEYQDSFIENVELEFNHKSLEYKGLNLTGKLDKIEVLDSVTRTVNVVDYKTGNPTYADSKLKPGADYHRQIAFYQLLTDLAFEQGVSTYRMQSGEIDFVQPCKTGEFKKAKIYITKEDLANLDLEIESFKIKLANRDFNMTEDVKLCSDCQFKNLCCR
ncbi:MAG: DEAD/DEAH box helicase [Cyanobacteria bacterium REEB446]|nr:DEAD/DEAH box helicase [Cyanobacteria bacterium REEB446]